LVSESSSTSFVASAFLESEASETSFFSASFVVESTTSTLTLISLSLLSFFYFLGAAFFFFGFSTTCYLSAVSGPTNFLILVNSAIDLPSGLTFSMISLVSGVCTSFGFETFGLGAGVDLAAGLTFFF